MGQENKITTKAFLGFVMALSALTAVAGTAWAGAVDLPPAWSQVLPGDRRFEVLDAFGGAAVLDKETGLVWERSPRTFRDTWANTFFTCAYGVVGGRRGWRLPVLEELASLQDTTQSDLFLPAGHPFANIQATHYWTATSYVLDDFYAYVVGFGVGGSAVFAKNTPAAFWCVRGGHGHDGR